MPEKPMAAVLLTAPGGSPAAEGSVGAHALTLFAGSCQRLVALQPEVLLDRDPEPLHQMRVAMRRLRASLRQFAPAVLLPPALREARLARLGRRLGMARDLDVLRHRLESDLLPQLPEAELQSLKPVLRQLRRERRLAGEQLAETLRSGSYLKLLSRLQKWLRQPAFTPLAEQPLADWLLPLQLPSLAEVFCHPGWFVTDPSAEADLLHDLRKRCKACRYALENLAPIHGPLLAPWIGRYRSVQQLLGDLNDLQVLEAAIADQISADLANDLPVLHSLLQRQVRGIWHDWQPLVAQLNSPASQQQLLLDLGHSLNTP
jgi:CHAD domain-containing protein